MAKIYVDSSATGANNGTSWADAYTSFGSAVTAAAAGDTILVEKGHYETLTTTTTYTFATGDLPPVVVYSADSADDSYSPATSFQIDTTISLVDIGVAGNAHIWGMWFQSSDDFGLQSNSPESWIRFTECKLRLGFTGGGDNPNFKYDEHGATHEFVNCTVEFSNDVNNVTNRFLINRSRILFTFIGCTFVREDNGVTSFINYNNNAQVCTGRFDAMDLSDMIDTNLVTIGGSSIKIFIQFSNCKLPSGITKVNGTLVHLSKIDFINVDDGSDHYRTELHRVGGVCETDSTVYRSGGWSDETGNTTGVPLSHKMTPKADASSLSPVEGIPLMAYIGSTGSKTFTVEAVENFTTALNDAEAWLELQYLGTSGDVTKSFDTTVTGPISAPGAASLTAGGGLVDWTAEPSGSRSVKLEKTVTVNNVGYYRVLVRLGKYESGKVFHYDPAVVVS